MSNIYLISDTHFGHRRPFIYEARGYKDIESHDIAIIENWNRIVQPQDEVYLLGDVMLNDNNYGINCLQKLNGKIHIIKGNHCTDTRVKLYLQCPNVVNVCDATTLKYKGYNFYLSHYPTLTGSYDKEKPLKQRVISLCGHYHTQDKFCDMDKGLIYHCELDAHNIYPVCIDTIIEDIKTFINNN